MITRRNILKTTASGFGYLALSGLSHIQAAEEGKQDDPLAAKKTHFPARAKRVIFLYMKGAPSHVDMFDYKPQLYKDHGKRGRYGGSLVQPLWDFKQRGESGLWISDLMPNVAQHADDLTLIRSMHCDQPLHPSAMIQMHTGTAQFVRPSLGAWTIYGLGTENDRLPGFVSMAPPDPARSFSSAFLPAIYGGMSIGRASLFGGAKGTVNVESVSDVRNSLQDPKQQRMQLDLIQSLNRGKLERDKVQPEIEGIIESYELAFRMQDAMPEVMSLSDETEATLSMYGANTDPTRDFGKQCLLARRFVEAGVRFVQVSHGNWDHHRDITSRHPTTAQQCDKPIAGLLQDLKQRDLLKDTLVIWGGEFGRTPTAQGSDGRDHNHRGFTTWMAGGGVKGGFSYGSTDEHGAEAIENKCHIHDWHATILHLLGLDHERLTYRHAGREFRLTDVHGNVVKDIIA